MDPELRLEAQWRASLGAYGGQVRCTHLMLGRVIDAVDSTVGRDNSIIVVHGDHGSRMHRRKPVRESVDAYTPAELNSAFATLLAVRRPHAAPALHQYPVSIQDAIWELARSGFKGPLSGQWQHELRSNPDSVGKALVRPLTTADMLWVRRPG